MVAEPKRARWPVAGSCPTRPDDGRAERMRAMRYYSTQRPVTPGSYPSSYAAEIVVNFDQKTFCEEIGREAWGRIDFADQLPEGEAEKWELTPAGLKMFWCVTTSFDDRGRVVSSITRTVEAAVKPENRYTSTSRKDIYTDWFDSLEAAQAWVEEAKQA